MGAAGSPVSAATVRTVLAGLPCFYLLSGMEVLAGEGALSQCLPL